MKTFVLMIKCMTTARYSFLRMFIILAWIFYALSAAETDREFTRGEREALGAVWGVRDMQSFIELEAAPKTFWEETERRLFEGKDKVLTHLDFCKWFTPILKKRLAKKLEKVHKKPWFAYTDIEDIVKKYKPDNFHCVLATCYTHIYDYTLLEITRERRRPKNSFPSLPATFCKTQEGFAKLLREMSSTFFTPMFSDKLRWKITPGGLFSFFESLVAYSKGYYLCSVSPDPEDWECFSLHEGQFYLTSGIQEHDAAHAKHMGMLKSWLGDNNISGKNQFRACCNPDVLVAGNLITMTHQVQAWFTQFHEAPSQVGGMGNCFDRTLLLFPGVERLSDTGFRDITPYFAHLPSDYDWRKNPLKKVQMSDDAIQGTLFAWRSLYCIPSFGFLDRSTKEYMKVLQKDCRYLTIPDLMRSPSFVRTILMDLCTLEGDSAFPSSPESFEIFLEKHKASAQIVLQTLVALSQEHPGPLIAYLPYHVHFLAITFYAIVLRALRSNCVVECVTAKSNFGLYDKDSKCLVCLNF